MSKRQPKNGDVVPLNHKVYSIENLKRTGELPLGMMLREHPTPGDWTPSPGDRPINDIIDDYYAILSRDGVEFYIWWTCPKCGDSVKGGDPLHMVDAPAKARKKYPEMAPKVITALAPIMVHLFDGNNRPCNTGVMAWTYPVSIQIVGETVRDS